MKKFKQWCRLLAIAPILLLFAGCGGGDSKSGVASAHYGPVGPTDPSGLYFDLTVIPIFVKPGATTGVTVRVWDEAGNRVGGVAVFISGGANLVSVLTDANGQLHTSETVSATEKGVVWFTATVETASITFPVQITGTATAAAGA